MDIPSQYPTPPPERYLAEIRAFLNRGGDPNQQDRFRETLLHAISRAPDGYEAVKELINAGSDINMVNFVGQTPLHIAVIHRNRHVVNVLIENGALVNISDCHGNTVLHFAVKACVDRHWNCTTSNCPHLPSDMDTVNKLLDHTSVNVNARNSNGYTPLLLAVKDKNLKAFEALLLNGRADVYIGNYFNETPLHAAVSYPNPCLGVAFALLDFGACLYCSNNEGHNPLDLVAELALKAEFEHFAGTFVKIVAFFNKNTQLTISSLQCHPGLLTLYRNCTEEINLMRMDIVAENFSVHNFVHCRMRKWIFLPIQNCVVIVRNLIAGRYPLYFEIILSTCMKHELYTILLESLRWRRYENISNRKMFSLVCALID